MTKDRRSGKERRKETRTSIVVDTEWESAAGGGRKPGIISDISTRGCYVLCSSEVEDGESVKIFLPLDDGMRVEFTGEVANHFFEIGFAVRFSDISDAHKEFLEKFIAAL